MRRLRPGPSVFFFNDTATTEIYTLSLHDALPILSVRCDGHLVVSVRVRHGPRQVASFVAAAAYLHQIGRRGHEAGEDRESTRLNSSHSPNSYAVFFLKKKKIESSPHTQAPWGDRS